MNFDIEKCLIEEETSIKKALEKVDSNQYGFVFIKNQKDAITGIATDGDIRRGLLQGLTLSDFILKCANRDFTWATPESSREQLIKQLDSHIKFIPILDDEMKLQYIVSNSFLPLDEERSVYIRSRAPVRMSFGGGGSDLTHFFRDSKGAVINSAISIYSHGVMKIRSDTKVIIKSLDLAESLVANNLDEAIKAKGSFGLIQSILHVVRPNYGFELYLNSDFPVGSGLGGSATLSAVVLGCFNKVRKDPWNHYELAEIAFQAERLHLGIAGGWQDQYASVFGGFNFIEFNKEENIVNPIRVHPDVISELEESLILCDTGIGHESGNIHEDQKETMSASKVQEMVKTNVQLTYKIRNHLLRGELSDFGQCLDQAWQLKRNFSSMITSNHLDSIYNEALKNGALGGKLLGAGGGGYFVFYVPPFEKHTLLEHLDKENLSVQNFRFEDRGLLAWSSRDTT